MTYLLGAALVVCIGYILRLWKRIRCLRHIYLTMSDEMSRRIFTARDEVIDLVGRERTPDSLVEAEKRWSELVQYQGRLMTDVGLRPAGEQDLRHPLEVGVF